MASEMQGVTFRVNGDEVLPSYVIPDGRMVSIGISVGSHGSEKHRTRRRRKKAIAQMLGLRGKKCTRVMAR